MQKTKVKYNVQQVQRSISLGQEVLSQFRNFSKMDFKTFAFFDLETTGLPQMEYNNTKITQLSLVACSVEHLLSINNIHDIPRVTHKLTICLNPFKRISLIAEEVTGLSNELLQHERKFDNNTLTLLKSFFQQLQQPVCLVAHNGNNFDFPIFKAHIMKLSDTLPSSLLCCDSLQVFRDIDKIQDIKCRILINGFIMKTPENIAEEEVKLINAEILRVEAINTERSEDDEIRELEEEFLSFENGEDMKARQTKNEKTPNKMTAPENKTPHPKNIDDFRKKQHSNVRRELFPLEDKKWPKGTFKLCEVYKRYFNEYPKNSHDAEDDVIALLKCACACKNKFVEIVKSTCIKFCDIKEL